MSHVTHEGVMSQILVSHTHTQIDGSLKEQEICAYVNEAITYESDMSHAHTHTHAHAHTHTHTHTHTQEPTHTLSHTHTNTHTLSHTHTNTHRLMGR